MKRVTILPESKALTTQSEITIGKVELVWKFLYNSVCKQRSSFSSIRRLLLVEVKNFVIKFFNCSSCYAVNVTYIRK